jgi:hypothetical protein
MTKKSRVLSATSTHSDGAVKQGNSEFGVENHQDDMMLIDPEETGAVNTHSDETPKTTGAKKAPVKAALHDEERPKGGRIAQIPNEVDPAAGYLDKEAGMPVINNASTDEMDVDEFGEVDADLETDLESDDTEDGFDDEVNSEFEDLADLGDDSEVDADLSDEFDDGGDDMSPLGEAMVEEETEPTDAMEVDSEEAPMDFEAEPSADEVALLDVDSVDDTATDDVAFATVANVVHVLKANRIIASMGPASARKVGMSDLYTSDQFHDVVEASLQKKGLRKGLVQSGFVLAKVKITASSKATAKVVEAKVATQVNAKMKALASRDEALDQSLAIAAVGINRQYFKGTTNELKAALETQLTQMGVRGASRMIRAAFAEHGVSYAKAIVTLAKKISAMPEEVRDQYASALDMTNDEDFDDGVDEELEAAEDDFMEDMPSSVTAALSQTPYRRSVPALLQAGVKTTAAAAILSGDTSLV